MSRRPLANLLSASTTDAPAGAVRGGRASTAPHPGAGWQLSAKQFYGGLIAISLIIGIASLLVPSTPSYDPWAWLVWGREIIHVNLQTTGGPTWKPLPVIFTTIFALFGKAQPDLWLVLARAGAFAAVVMVFRLSARLTRAIGSYFTGAPSVGEGILGWLPGLLAGGIAALGLAFSGGYLSSNTLGYSEGLATAAILIAVERHFDGHPRQAFAVGFLGALDRPEMWLFWGPYGLWLYWRDAGARKLVISLFVLIPIVWFAPEYWGSGHFLRGASRAQHVRSNSLALARCPFCSELVKAAWPTVLLRIKAAAIVLVGVVAVVMWRGRRTLRGFLASPRTRAQSVAAAAGLLGLAWFIVIAVMTQAGFSGNNRYLVFGSALIEICGGVAWGWAAQEIGNVIAGGLSRGRAGGSRALSWSARVVAVGVVGLAFLLLPSWVGGNLIDIPVTHRSIVYQASLRTGVSEIVNRYGGAAKLLRCGSVMTEGFQVPMVAWTLGVHTSEVQAPPPAEVEPDPASAPNVILQTRASRNLALLPYLSQWPGVHYRYFGHSGPFRLFTHCRG